MKYRETLDFINKSNLNVVTIEVAYACDCAFDFEYTDEEFEQLCNFANHIYIETDNIMLWDIAYTINTLIKDEEMSIDEVVNMAKWDFIDEMPI